MYLLEAHGTRQRVPTERSYAGSEDQIQEDGRADNLPDDGLNTIGT
jgi:hypothetical protein